jgi:hypothetical protein
MTDKSTGQLSPQWKILHDNYEKYEQYSLVIKLITICVTVCSIALIFSIVLTISIITVLWLQEAIWKTYQSRLSDAIITLEQDNTGDIHLYSQWQEKRPSKAKLIKEYIYSALKPTVAFPYAPLMVIVVVFQ